jgi:hypothetical protein
MMAILDRRFPETAPETPLTVDVGEADKPILTEAWLVVAKRSTIEQWSETRPKFSTNVKYLAFEAVVDAFGGRVPFNELVREMLMKIDFYKSWIEESEGAG